MCAGGKFSHYEILLHPHLRRFVVMEDEITFVINYQPILPDDGD